MMITVQIDDKNVGINPALVESVDTDPDGTTRLTFASGGIMLVDGTVLDMIQRLNVGQR